jgi:hypothetical protein
VQPGYRYSSRRSALLTGEGDKPACELVPNGPTSTNGVSPERSQRLRMPIRIYIDTSSLDANKEVSSNSATTRMISI